MDLPVLNAGNKWMLMFRVICFFLLAFSTSIVVQSQSPLGASDLTVLDLKGDQMMRTYLTKIVDEQFDRRDKHLASLKSKEDWDQRSATIRDSFVAWAGPFPEKNPLNARITGTVRREGYVIQNVVFESRPNYFVSANLYLPSDMESPGPALLNVIGHAALGKADPRYQHMSANMARKGFVVLTMDGIGQGERRIDSYQGAGESPSVAHRILGTKAFLSGTHLFNLMIWDAIRAVDYLCSRPEVDQTKICMTGSSGGGMISTYILPLDDRIAVSVPTCNPNSWDHRVHHDLSADHEQVFFGAFESLIDPRGDPLFCQSPKPLLINSTTDDPLNPARGVWKLSTSLQKAYQAQSVPEKITTTMVDAGHDYNREQREITYGWMLKWTGGNASNNLEESITLETEELLWATENGNVFDEPDAVRPEDLVQKYLDETRKERGWSSKGAEAISEQDTLMERIRQLLNIPSEITVKSETLGETVRKSDGYLKSFEISPEAGILLPGVLLSHDENFKNKDVVLFLHDRGKSRILEEKDVIRQILEEGKLICAIDLRGFGETAPDMGNKFWDFLSGRPIFGQRVQDILCVVHWLKGPSLESGNVDLWGQGMTALYGTFASVLEPGIASLFLEESLISFEDIIRVEVPQYNHEILLPGLLQYFDMPRLYHSLGDRAISIVNPLRGDKTNATDENIEDTFPVLTQTTRNRWKCLVLNSLERKSLLSEMLAH